MTTLKFMATCPKGLGSLLGPELAELGAVDVRETVAGVEFSGSLAVAYRACLHSRFANRVLLILSEFAAADANDLYEGVLRLPWHEHIAERGTLTVDFAGRSSDIRNTQFGAQRVKDAIVDGFRRRGMERPNVDTRYPDVRINVRLYRGKLTVAIDLSGNSLHRRGYRSDPGKAPLKENLAAAMLARAGWPASAEAGLSLIDPMCGSGTLLIEAALMAIRRPVGLARQGYGFDKWLGHNPEQWAAIVADGRAQECAPPEGMEIRGYDGDIRAVRRAESIVAELGLEQLVRVRAKSLNELTRPSHRPMPKGLLVCNPPWGERIGEVAAMKHLYRQLGEVMHREFQGWDAAVVTSNPDLGRAVGLRSHRQYSFNNGAIDIRLLLFALTADNHLSPQPGSAVSGGKGVGLAANVWASATAAVSNDADDDLNGAPNDDAGPTQQSAGAKQIAGAPQAKSHAQAPVLTEGAQMFANRLRKNQRKLKSWLRQSGVGCYRLYDADMPEYAVAVDIYEGHIHVAEYAPPKNIDEASATRRFDEVVSGIRAVFELPENVDIATKRRQRQRGTEQYGKFAQRQEQIVVQEGRAKLLVNLHDYLDTGLFLDHRPLRSWLAKEAKGKHFLNLFCYTGAASIQAALGGATTSTSVDLSNTYLNWYRENLALNGLSERQHRAERSDCVAWLEACERTFDLILLDPPSFSNSKATEESFDVQRDHTGLVALAMARLAPGGVMYFSNNRRGFKLDPSLNDTFAVTDVTRESIPEDFRRGSDIHRCWRLQHR